MNTLLLMAMMTTLMMTVTGVILSKTKTLSTCQMISILEGYLGLKGWDLRYK